MTRVKVIGAGLAGSEAAWQLAKRGIEVDLYEMRPKKSTPAHKTELFGELVCSNSLRAANIENAVGLLKEEMTRLDSLIMRAARETQVPAGGAMAVDRVRFSEIITDTLRSNPLIHVITEEVTELPGEGITVLATGPLTSESLAEDLAKLSSKDDLYFYDAAAPIVNLDSIDQSKGYWASRYGKGDKDYFNCPMTREEYETFYNELIKGEVHPAKDFEKEKFFEGCMPVEVLAYRGPKTLLFGPLKPVGLEYPGTDETPYAVVQLRQDNAACTLMNIVGFQTRLTRPEQRRIFSLIPALENAEFARYGMVHRNTFMNSPDLMERTGQLKPLPHIFPAGQMTGVEGYVESAAQGLAAGINASRLARGKEPIIWPEETAIGSLYHYICTTEGKHFQPMNITFGIMPELEGRYKDKKLKAAKLAERALKVLQDLIDSGEID